MDLLTSIVLTSCLAAGPILALRLLRDRKPAAPHACTTTDDDWDISDLIDEDPQCALQTLRHELTGLASFPPLPGSYSATSSLDRRYRATARRLRLYAGHLSETRRELTPIAHVLRSAPPAGTRFPVSTAAHEALRRVDGALDHLCMMR